MKPSLVTIVVPVYGVEAYLDRCVESLVGQTYPNLEIILVDDCSPDGSPRICDQWAARDARIKVIHKEKNEGQGIARNDGMDCASGEYICFFDSDDYIKPDAIRRTLEAIQAENAELAIFGMETIAADGTVKSRFVPPVGARTYRGREVQEFFLPNLIAPDPKGDGTKLFYMSACLMMYSMKALRGLGWRFVSEREIISEDTYSLLDLLGGINSVIVVTEAFYCIYENPSSFSRGYKPNRYERILHFYLESLELCRRKGYSQEIQHRMSEPYLSFTMAALKQEAKAPLPLSRRRANVYGILRDPTLRQTLVQNRGDWAKGSRKLMYFLIRNRLYGLCYLLCALKK